MPISKGSFAIALASIAVAISCYGAFFKSAPLVAHQFDTEILQKSVKDLPKNSHDSPPSITELHNKISALQRQVANLNLQNPTANKVQNTDEFKELVLAVLVEKEQEEVEKMREENPLYGFYADLPQDYELRIKSEPEYAKKVTAQLREQILNPNLADIDRLAALSQLQMNMYILNKSKMPEYDFEVVDNILDLAENSTDDKFKIQAIEVTTQSPVLDYRLAERFTSLLKQDSNDYIRRLAGQGLLAQYYQAQDSQNEYSKQIAQHILSLYQNTSDSTVKSVLNDMMGNESLLEEMRKHTEG
ncbi:hypothetical protein HH219_17820 [Pseudoalteromonas sp. NEC-BIFX-2020_015]|uniref:hypothetical protein n=1 Tax=Pseudoalteromonas sp. NEC-BIFX-2020_015 TaxID=2729544 RepID=UPI0014616819|nr:hypothetical protein [Pseudoalteromonas sp. NEC-BIFX-2020_015]NMR27368.1 hypothetical protein [Pseudoalteromonas sp. NEC-BIFX-2020_015]